MNNNITASNALVPQHPRRPVDAATLHRLVDLQVMGFISRLQEFTAYTVTVNLRHFNPTLEIIHEEVRQRVHFYMQNIYAGQLPAYDFEDRVYLGGQVALTYFPLTAVISHTVTVSHVPQPTPKPLPPPPMPAPTPKPAPRPPQLPAKVGVQIDWED